MATGAGTGAALAARSEPGWVLRDYQQAAVAATLRHFRRSHEPACLVLPTGAGKSLVIAELARLARGRIVVLSHVKELCEQNYEKYSRSGRPAGLYAAGLGRRESDQQVTFASVQSLCRNLTEFSERYSLLVIDECHRLSQDEGSQYQQVIRHLSRREPRLKVLGLTATPYRLGLGWVYQKHYKGRARAEAARPFARCIFEVSIQELIKRGFLTPPRVVDAAVAHYDFGALPTDARGHAPTAAVNELLGRHPRVTQAIVGQVRELAAGRQGVMLFAASVEHAREIAGHLPAEQTAVIVGETPGPERDAVVEAFKRKQLRFLVNVSVLTTGFDAPHVDFIAILRPTQSVSLLQQMVGRGLRLSAGKRDCLVVDYAANGIDLFHPEVGEPRPNSESQPVEVACPECGFGNLFWGKRDTEGAVVEHYGRRCQALLSRGGAERRCEYRFQFKECGRCAAPCDIAARRCPQCDSVLIDADDQLKKALGLKGMRVLRVAGLTLRREKDRVWVTYHDEEGTELRERFDFSQPAQRAAFGRIFSRRLPSSGAQPPADAPSAVRLQPSIKPPDFVIAKRQKYGWRVQERLFDYQGRYRKAHAL